MKTKQCTKCKENKDLSEFSKSKHYASGYYARCKDCVRLAKKDYYNRNKKSIIERNKKYYEATKNDRKDILEKTRKKCYQKHKELRSYNAKMHTKTLSDSYIRTLLSRLPDLGINRNLIPRELVELKRTQVKLYREIYK